MSDVKTIHKQQKEQEPKKLRPSEVEYHKQLDLLKLKWHLKTEFEKLQHKHILAEIKEAAKHGVLWVRQKK